MFPLNMPFGRRQLLDLVYASCPHSYKKTDGVPCCTCPFCVHTFWAKQRLSRKCLQFTKQGDGAVVLRVQTKSCHRVKVIRDNHELDMTVNKEILDGSAWSASVSVMSGDVLKLLDTQENTQHLEFELNIHCPRPPRSSSTDNTRSELSSMSVLATEEDDDTILSQPCGDDTVLPRLCSSPSQSKAGLKGGTILDSLKVIQRIEQQRRARLHGTKPARYEPKLKAPSARQQSADLPDENLVEHPSKSTDGDRIVKVDREATLKHTPAVSERQLQSATAAPPDENDTTGRTHPNENKAESQYVLYFVPLGSDMHTTHIDGHGNIEGLRSHVERRGARVLDQFDRHHPPYPTHFVVSDRQLSSDMAIVEKLGFDSRSEFCEFLGQHGSVCVSRKWASRGNRINIVPLASPTMKEQYHGLFPTKKRKSYTAKSLESPRDKWSKVVDSPVERNQKLSALFKELSKLYQGAPLDENDDWRAYSFNVISGRVRHLSFDVEDSPKSLQRLKATRGFGNSTMKIVQEFIETSTSSRIEFFKTDKKRKGMREMMNIWGVGRKRATSLVHEGYTRIGSVRYGLKNGALKLERNQYIGVLCYEDILERMERSEVEAIAAIVSEAVKQRYPSAEVTIMGSYRRKKADSGDVDIMITHPDYVDTVPPQALGMIVDDLRSLGHIEHHLTFIAGMNPEKFESLDKSVAQKLTNPKRFGRSKEKKNKDTSSSWMGVMMSPVIANKRRRVDIKFYPYSERVFASLHFTGSGHYNRSMRLWATRKKGWKLSDHGLIDIGTNRPVFTEPPQTEKEVFERIGIRWKEPNERDCFDAVECAESGRTVSMILDDLTKAELRAEESSHQWID